MNRKSCLLAAVFSFALVTVSLADKAVEAAQQKLKDQGFYYGEITGAKDADTTAAIRRYQIRNGLQITGELNSETLGSLGVSSKPAATPVPRPKQTPGPTPPGFLEDGPAPTATPMPHQPAPPPDYQQGPDADVQPNAPPIDRRTPFAQTPYENAPPQVQQDIVMQAQIRLIRQGYYRDQVDGLYGPAMNFALRGFQARFGLQPTGQLDVETLAALRLLPEQRLSRYPHSRRHFFAPWARRGPGDERIYIPR